MDISDSLFTKKVEKSWRVWSPKHAKGAIINLPPKWFEWFPNDKLRTTYVNEVNAGHGTKIVASLYLSWGVLSQISVSKLVLLKEMNIHMPMFLILTKLKYWKIYSIKLIQIFDFLNLIFACFLKTFVIVWANFKYLFNKHKRQKGCFSTTNCKRSYNIFFCFFQQVIAI